MCDAALACVREYRATLERRKPTAAIRELLAARDGLICHYCGVELPPDGWHVDHLHPLDAADDYPGDIDEPANLVLACLACNASKGARTVTEWQTTKTHPKARTYAGDTPLGRHSSTDNTLAAVGHKLQLRRWVAARIDTVPPVVLDVFPGEHIMRRAWPPATVYATGDGGHDADVIDCDPWGDPWPHLVAAADACTAEKPRLGIVWTDGTHHKSKTQPWVSASVTELTGIAPFRGAARRSNRIAVQRAAIDGLAARIGMTAGTMKYHLRTASASPFYAAAILSR